MTTTAGFFLGAAALFAVTDWVAVRLDHWRLEYVCKPASLLALTGFAITLDPQVEGRRVAFVVALLFSLAGDILLMVRRERNGKTEKGLFVPGLAAFLVAHLAYIVGFQIEGGAVWLVALLFVLIRVATLPVTVRLLSALREGNRERLAGPVRAYAIVICGMAAAAAATGNVLAIVGAALFLVSDLLIAWSRFVVPLAWAPVTIIVTYHLAQAGLILSLV